MSNIRFNEWIENRDPDLYNEVNWKNIGRNAVIAGSMLGAGLSGSQSQTPQSYPVQQQSLYGNKIAQQNYKTDLQSLQNTGNITNRSNSYSTSVKSITQAITRVMNDKFEDSLVEIIETKNIAEGTLVVMSFSGEVEAYSQQHANELASSTLNQIAQQNNILIKDLQLLGENYNQLFKVKIKFNIIIPSNK